MGRFVDGTTRGSIDRTVRSISSYHLLRWWPHTHKCWRNEQGSVDYAITIKKQAAKLGVAMACIWCPSGDRQPRPSVGSGSFLYAIPGNRARLFRQSHLPSKGNKQWEQCS